MNDTDINLEELIAYDIERDIQQKFDWDIMADILQSIGWTKVYIHNVYHPNEINEWLNKNINKSYHTLGSTWLFQDSNDAVLFTLRWS